MAVEMMNSYQRDIFRKRQRLGRSHADNQSSHETRSVSNADQIDIIDLHARLRKRLGDHRRNIFQMLSRRDLRYHAAVQRVNIDLRRYDIRIYFSSIG